MSNQTATRGNLFFIAFLFVHLQLDLEPVHQ